jgi:hypothetical protein
MAKKKNSNKKTPTTKNPDRYSVSPQVSAERRVIRKTQLVRGRGRSKIANFTTTTKGQSSSTISEADSKSTTTPPPSSTNDAPTNAKKGIVNSGATEDVGYNVEEYEKMKKAHQVQFTRECNERLARFSEKQPATEEEKSPRAGEAAQQGFSASLSKQPAMEEKESSKAAEAAQGLSASLSKQPAMEEEKEDPKAGEAAQGFTASLSNWSSAIKPTTEAPLDLNTRESEESWQEKQKQSLQRHNGMNLEGEMAAIMGGSKYASIGQAPSAVKQSQDWGDEGDVLVFPNDGGEMKVEFNAEQEEYTTEAQFAHGTDTDDVHISVVWLLKNHSKMYRVKPDEDLNGIFVDFKALAPDKPRKLLFSFEDKSVEATDTAKKLGLKNGATIYAYTEEEEEEANKIDMPLGNINVNIGYYDQEFSLDGVSMDTLMEAVFK